MAYIDISMIMFGSLLVIAAIFDVVYRIIPNWICGFVILLGFVVHVTFSGMAGWFTAGAGMLLGLALLLPLYIGKVLGAGDVKLMAAVCAYAGIGNVFNSLALIILMGGVVGVLHIIVNKATYFAPILVRYYPADRDIDRSLLPYGLAIAAGGVLAQLYTFVNLSI